MKLVLPHSQACCSMNEDTRNFFVFLGFCLLLGSQHHNRVSFCVSGKEIEKLWMQILYNALP
jgi:hypothetical protein